jgi:hypothetical protein
LASADCRALACQLSILSVHILDAGDCGGQRIVNLSASVAQNPDNLRVCLFCQKSINRLPRLKERVRVRIEDAALACHVQHLTHLLCSALRWTAQIDRISLQSFRDWSRVNGPRALKDLLILRRQSALVFLNTSSHLRWHWRRANGLIHIRPQPSVLASIPGQQRNSDFISHAWLRRGTAGHAHPFRRNVSKHRLRSKPIQFGPHRRLTSGITDCIQSKVNGGLRKAGQHTRGLA